MAEIKNSKLDELIFEIEKKFGKGAITTLKGSSVFGRYYSSGILSLDIALGTGGYPLGRILEVYGPESSGKTTIALQAISSFLQVDKDKYAAFIDAEHALDRNYACNLGIDPSRLIIAQPDHGEQALSILESLIKSNKISIAVIDSVAALIPQAELQGEVGDHHVGAQARMMSKCLRKLTGVINNSKCTVLFINQMRMKIGVVYGNPEVTTGGNALKFYSSIRLEIRKGSIIKNKDQSIGHAIKIKVVKNKLGAPFRDLECELIYGKGIDKTRDLFNIAVCQQIVEKAGTWYNYKSSKLGHGKDAAIRNISVEVYKEILQHILKANFNKKQENF